MKNPITTVLAIFVFLGVVARAVMAFLSGDMPDPSELWMAFLALLGALGLYKAVDPPTR